MKAGASGADARPASNGGIPKPFGASNPSSGADTDHSNFPACNLLHLTPAVTSSLGCNFRCQRVLWANYL